MIINCTKKLQEELDIKPEKLEITDRLYSWHAHIIRVNRRKTVVLVNDASRYQVVLYGLKAKDFKNLSQLILDGIATILLSDGVNPQLVDAYLEQCGFVAYSKGQGAKYTAWLNKGCEIAEWYGDECDEGDLVQRALSRRGCYNLGKLDDKDYAVPAETFYDALEQRFGYPKFSCQAVVLTAKLETEGFDIWRKVVVPLRFTFEQLHEIMQILFDWKDYHLHEFLLLEGEKPLVCLVLDEEMVYDVAPMKAEVEAGVLLSNYLPKCKKLVYTYDFGDNWEHTITVEKVLFDYQCH
ncbi:plasmid pRiA4b ORF-3 family protein [Bengtsoniella intestinalis]|uniref:plasmid pRiA4b ORF-3 family protein n=1 Tax=Bengtsoniella intestinalis TaxID=3073143 RepID=UPI00391F1E8E